MAGQPAGRLRDCGGESSARPIVPLFSEALFYSESTRQKASVNETQSRAVRLFAEKSAGRMRSRRPILLSRQADSELVNGTIKLDSASPSFGGRLACDIDCGVAPFTAKYALVNFNGGAAPTDEISARKAGRRELV